MRSIIKTFLCVSVMFSAACSEYPHVLSNTVATDKQNANIVSIDESLTELNHCLDYIDVKTRGGKKREIGEIHVLGGGTRGENGGEEPLIYLVNFTGDKGYALLSGDRRVTPVLAITDEGSLDPEKGTDNPGLMIFLHNADTYYRSIAGLPVNRDSNLVYLPLEDYGDTTSPVETRTEITLPSIQYTDWFTWGSSGEILASQWSQRSPFNSYCYTSEGKQAPAGCQAIAVGQIMYHHAKNFSYGGRYYDWAVMKTVTSSASGTSTAKDLVDRFIHALGKSMGTAYGTNNSTASTNAIPNGFAAFGYSRTGTIKNYNFEDIQFELGNSPVIVRGDSFKTVTPKKVLGITVGQNISYSGGHAWVIDKYICQYRYRIVKDKNGNETSRVRLDRKLVHCNWGWGGTDDGYYFSEAFDTNSGRIETRGEESNLTTEGTNSHYQFNIKMVLNIRP